MKRKFFLYLAAVATMSLTLAACSKDDTTDSGVKFKGDKAYAKVSIKMASGTRALDNSDTSFVAGSKDESAITNLTIVLTADGQVCGFGSYNEYAFTNGTDHENVEKQYDNVVLPITMSPGTAVPDHLYAFVNMTPEFLLESEILNAETEKLALNISKAENFVMTNSGYYDGSNWVVGVPVTKAILNDTEDAAAKADPIEIYVERLAARVQVANESATVPSNTKAVFKSVDDVEYTIEFKAKKWGVTGIANSMYLFKQKYQDAETLSGFDWTWANGTKRSFWAKGVYYNNSYSDYTTDAAKNGMLTYLSASQLIANGAENAYEINTTLSNAVYVPEHTFGTAAQIGLDEDDPELEGKFAPKFTGTNVIVVGKYEITGGAAATAAATRFKGSSDDEVEYDFYISLKAKDGDKYVYAIYSKKDLIERLVALNGLTLSDNNGEPSADFDVTKFLTLKDKTTSSDAYSLVKVETNNAPLYKKTADGYDAVNYGTDFGASINAAHYRNGWAYFMAPIEHNFGADKGAGKFDEKTVGSYGIVRNHAYQLTIKSYTGLGAPLDESKIGEDPTDPEDETKPQPEPPIIPDPSEQTESFINAQLNVLSWHTVSQEVNF